MRCWMKPSNVRKMNLADIGWLAGFLDGEGSISKYMGGRQGRYESWVMTAPNTNFSSVRKCKRITGVGTIRDKKIRIVNPKHKPMKIWAVNSKREIRDILTQVLPHLVIKDKAARKFLKNFREV